MDLKKTQYLRQLKSTLQPLYPGFWSPLVHREIGGGKLKAELLELGSDFGRPPWRALVHEFQMKVSTTNYNQQHPQILQPIKMN